MQARYQYGDLTLRKRKKGPAVWQFRWFEDGRRKSLLIGTLKRLPNRVDAERAVEHLRSRINAENPQQQFHSATVGGLIDRFMDEYAPRHCRKHTAQVYSSLFKNHVRPRWGAEFVQHVKPMAVEEWLASYPHSRQIKAHVKGLMHILFQAAVRWEMVDRNPLDAVRQSCKRLHIPRTLTPAEFRALVANLAEPHKTMVTTVACLGLRVCELLALQWGDIDFETLTVRIQRSIVQGEVNPTKTEASESPLPIDPALGELLSTHRARSAYLQPTDFVFAGNSGRPPWANEIVKNHIKAAAARAGITGKVGWHTFRHSYSTLLRALGTDIKVQQELLRHSSVNITLNTYTRAVTEKKREAAGRVTAELLGMVQTGTRMVQ
jgi:integrase